MPSRRQCLLAGPSVVAAAAYPHRIRANDASIGSVCVDAMLRASAYFAENVATHGGYVYFYSLDLSERFGEGRATRDQIWVQPPGTPTVGMAFLDAYEATGERAFLRHAVNATRALVKGQLQSGGWTNAIDFDPNGSLAADYRRMRGGRKNNSSLDDDQTTAALELVHRTNDILTIHDHGDAAAHADIRETARTATASLLDAQHAAGSFPQVWDGPVVDIPPAAASYPDDDWRTEGRVKAYWDLPTLNDNVGGNVARLMIRLFRKTGSPTLRERLERLAEFFVAAQMPMPQPGWAQQYRVTMQPAWARKFEPPAIASDETQEAIDTLIDLAETLQDDRWLRPIPAALGWLQQSRLPDGSLARYYELRTNRPLYMRREGKIYSLTYSDRDLPDHYGWKIQDRTAALAKRYGRAVRGDFRREPSVVSRQQVQRILASLDTAGRWVSTGDGSRLIGDNRFAEGVPYLSSERFADNLSTLAKFVQQSS